MTEEEYYAQIKSEYEASTDAKLVAWAQPYFDGTKKPNGKDKYIICPVSERAAQDIFELHGKNVHGFNHAISCDNIRHVDKRHGKKGKVNNSMQNIDDLGRLAYVLNNYDYIYTDDEKVYGVLDKQGKPAESVVFVKRINGYVISAEAITDSPNKKTLYIRSMYKAKTIQKESRMVDSNSPRPNVQNAYGSSTSILPQPEKNVNSFEKYNSDIAEQPPSFSEIAEQNKNYCPPRKPRTSDNGNSKKPPDKGNSGR